MRSIPARELVRGRRWELLNYDFCPSLNRYVYWLKEPIGWFITALIVCIMVGLWVTPIGWTLAGAIGLMLVAGVAWPLIAVWSAGCTVKPEIAIVSEGEEARLIFTVRNRLPVPIWGLAVEGYFDRKGAALAPTMALAWVPPLSEADYVMPLRVTHLGRYPVTAPRLSCAFPFGIWTARRTIRDVAPLTAWPKRYPVLNRCPWDGAGAKRDGEGVRSGGEGELLGCRPYRRGDSPRNVHWIATARTGELIVVERGARRQVLVDIALDLRVDSRGLADASDEELKWLPWMLRAAASVVSSLRREGVAGRLLIGKRAIHFSGARDDLQTLMDALLDVAENPELWLGQAVQQRVCNPAVVLRVGCQQESVTMETTSANGSGTPTVRSLPFTEGNFEAVIQRTWEG